MAALNTLINLALQVANIQQAQVQNAANVLAQALELGPADDAEKEEDEREARRKAREEMEMKAFLEDKDEAFAEAINEHLNGRTTLRSMPRRSVWRRCSGSSARRKPTTTSSY